MNRKTLVIGTAVGGGLLALVTVWLGCSIGQPMLTTGATPTQSGAWSFILSLLGASGLSVTSLVAWFTGGRVSKSTPELLASLVAWLAAKGDKTLERRFVLAVLATLDELFVDQPVIRNIVSQLGAAIVSAWLPSQEAKP